MGKMVFLIPDDITDFSTFSATILLPENDILRQHIYGVIAELCNPDNYDENLDEEYRYIVASTFTKILLDLT